MHLRPRVHLRFHFTTPSFSSLSLSLRRTTPSLPPTTPHHSSPPGSSTSLLLHRRPFHTTRTHAAGSPFFALGALSNSRESQWFKKASGLSAVEHSTNLELIRSSEVVPFQKPKVGVSSAGPRRKKAMVAGAKVVVGGGDAVVKRGVSAGAVGVGGTSVPAVVAKVSARDAKALAVGREVLKRNTRTVARLKSLLGREKRVHTKEREKLVGENRRLRRENRGASVGLVVAVGVATAVVAWKTWPEARKPRVAFKSLVEDVAKHPGEEIAGSLDLGESLDPMDVIRVVAQEAEEEEDSAYLLSMPHKTRQVVELETVAFFMPSAGLEVSPPDAMKVQPGGKKRGWYSWFWDL